MPRVNQGDEVSLRKRNSLAVNSPIQNTAGDLAKAGFSNLFEDPRLRQLDVNFLTTVHDSILLSVPESVDKVLIERIIKEDMESADPNFPIEVKVSFGLNWGEMV